LVGTISLCVVLVCVAYFLLRAEFRVNPVYRESLAVARSSPEVQSLLGSSIQEGWAAFVEVRHVYGSDFAEWTASIKGPKGRGWLYGVANRIGSSWHYSRLLFTLNGNKKIVDLTPPPPPDRLLSGESKKNVFLVPLGTVPDAYLAWAPAYYKAKFALNVEVLPVIPLRSSVWNAKRRQLIAENLIALMKQALPETLKDQSAILIGVTTGDMFIQSYDWRYAINYREDGRFAVVSAARLPPTLFFQKWNHALEISRLQKMITKNVYLECFDAPMSSDYTSAVSGGVMSPAEVDYMSDEIVGAENRWQSMPSGMAPTISVVLNTEQPAAWNMEWSGKPPTDVATEYLAANLWAGVLIQRKTDFYLNGDFPLQFVRTYASRDVQSREFGAGTNDSLDISIGGVPEKYMALTLENGVQTYFDRDVRGDSGGRQAYRGRADYFSPFSRGTIFMRGFDVELETTEGWHYFFPYRPAAKAEDKYLVLTDYSDPQGKRFEMQRNKTGELLRVTTPEGKWLNFQRDEQNRFRRIEDSEGRAVNYDYDSKGDLIRVSDSRGNTVVYRYDEKDQMVEVLDGHGHAQMTTTYSPDGRITGQTLADGRTFQYEYRRGKGGSLAQIRFTDPRGYVTLFDYVGERYLQSLPSKSADPKQSDAQPFLE
jgi:YD repeat-containing protein